MQSNYIFFYNVKSREKCYNQILASSKDLEIIDKVQYFRFEKNLFDDAIYFLCCLIIWCQFMVLLLIMTRNEKKSLYVSIIHVHIDSFRTFLYIRMYERIKEKRTQRKEKKLIVPTKIIFENNLIETTVHSMLRYKTKILFFRSLNRAIFTYKVWWKKCSTDSDVDAMKFQMAYVPSIVYDIEIVLKSTNFRVVFEKYMS